MRYFPPPDPLRALRRAGAAAGGVRVDPAGLRCDIKVGSGVYFTSDLAGTPKTNSGREERRSKSLNRGPL